MYHSGAIKFSSQHNNKQSQRQSSSSVLACFSSACYVIMLAFVPYVVLECSFSMLIQGGMWNQSMQKFSSLFLRVTLHVPKLLVGVYGNGKKNNLFESYLVLCCIIRGYPRAIFKTLYNFSVPR